MIIDLIVIFILIIGIRMFRAPKGARAGNLTAAFALLCALFLVLYRNDILDPGIVIAALAIGSALGWIVAMRVSMIQIPAMVAFQHGAGGVAAFLVSFLELSRHTAEISEVGTVAGIMGLVVGAATFSGSMIACGKLANKLKQTPTVLPKHDRLIQGNLLLIVAIGIMAAIPSFSGTSSLLILLICFSMLLGIVFSIRIGGADMPVLISFLNATAGLAAALCGIIIQNRLLIACGATVAASGSILTLVMCRAMNRNLIRVFIPVHSKPVEGAEKQEKAPRHTAQPAMIPPAEEDPFAAAVRAVSQARSVIIIPGYGMALARAQFNVAQLARMLEQMGKEVAFAIHPVAGRMPGHMNVLLAEAEVSYDKLIEMDEINPRFKDTDLAMIVGACDVVNPAAIETEGTPISGMPILMAHQARHVLVLNLDENPGYSGVENPLYRQAGAIMLLGNAKDTVGRILSALFDETAATESGSQVPEEDNKDPLAGAAELLKSSNRIIIIPGYGMALAGAQFNVAQLARMLEQMGKEVRFAIHPVAGRMPGHMNVLLAEAEVSYDKLIEMDEINPRFKDTDLAMIVGACDVVNPAAIETEGTPISGMPILMAHQARHVLVLNLDENPGYSGVENPLYREKQTLLIPGDAKKSTKALIELISA